MNVKHELIAMVLTYFIQTVDRLMLNCRAKFLGHCKTVKKGLWFTHTHWEFSSYTKGYSYSHLNKRQFSLSDYYTKTPTSLYLYSCLSNFLL